MSVELRGVVITAFEKITIDKKSRKRKGKVNDCLANGQTLAKK